MNNKMLQKVFWHIRWVILVFLMLLTLFIFIDVIHLELKGVILITIGTFSIYFLLLQLEKYMECQFNCKK